MYCFLILLELKENRSSETSNPFSHLFQTIYIFVFYIFVYYFIYISPIGTFARIYIKLCL